LKTNDNQELELKWQKNEIVVTKKKKIEYVLNNSSKTTLNDSTNSWMQIEMTI